MMSCYRKNVGLLLASAILLIFIAAPAVAVVIHVPGDYETIQEAVDAASDGDVVRVAAGTYTGDGNRDIRFYNKSIVLESVGGADVTIIDCEDWGRGFFFSTDEADSPDARGTELMNKKPAVDSEVTIDGFTVINGRAWAGGGIIVSNGNHPVIKDCRFINCSAPYDGGAVFVAGDAYPSFVECEIVDNSAEHGGGIRVGDTAYPSFADCAINENTSNRGGGVYTQGVSTARFTNCDVSGNEAALGAGFAIDDFSMPSLDGCKVTGNRADFGGGINVFNHSEPEIDGCTIAANYAAYDGGGIYASGGSTDASKTVVWGNCAGEAGDQIFAADGSSIGFACSDVDDAGVEGPGEVAYDASTIFEDPLFCGAVSCESAPTTDGDYTLDDDSPALAAQSLCGELIGALPEGCEGRTFEVGGEGPIDKIQDAIDLSVSNVGDVVEVAAGVWEGERNTELDFGGKNIVLKAKDGPAIIDGGGEVRAIAFRNGEDYRAVVDGFTIKNGNPEEIGSAILVTGNSSPTFVDCKIEENDAENGVICVESGTPTFKFCNIEGNTATGPHGVVALVGGAPRLMSSRVCGNDAPAAVMVSTPTQVWQSEISDNSGCGMYFEGTTTSIVIGSDISRNGDRGVILNEAAATFADVTFKENVEGGVAVTGLGNGEFSAAPGEEISLPHAVSGQTDFVSCEFSGHSADRGAGFFFDCTNEPEVAYTVTFADCRFTGNHATFEGGAVAICGRATNANITPIFTGCTIAANSAQDGGGIYMGVQQVGIGREARAQVDQTILWGNCSTTDPQGEAFVLAGNELEVNCSHAGVDEIGGGGTIALTDVTTGIPAFCDYPGLYYTQGCNTTPTTQGDFNLSPNSPAAPGNHPCGPDQVGAFPVQFCTPTAIPDEQVPALTTELRPPSPNPFNPTTTVQFVLESRSYVTIAIYDVAGRRVATLVDREMPGGVHEVVWDGRDASAVPAASGVYFARMEAGSTTQTQKLVLLK